MSPAADHFRNVFLIDFLLEQPVGAVLTVEAFFLFPELALQGEQFTVFQLGRPVQVVLPFGLLDFDLGLLDLLAEVAEPLDVLFLRLPACLEGIPLGPELGKLLL